MGFPGGSMIKNLLEMQEMQVWSLGQDYLLEKEIVAHSSNLACEILQAEKPAGLESVGAREIWTQHSD